MEDGRVEKSFLKKAFLKRPNDLHKYTAGTVAIVGGSEHFVHAPVIAGLGARAAGAGLVQLVVPDASRSAAGALVPEATFIPQSLPCPLAKADVSAIGMGLGLAPSSKKLLSHLLSGKPGRFVLDADALTILASWPEKKRAALQGVAGQTLVLTPHVGEAARLLGCTSHDILAGRPAALKRLVARYHAVVVLKGPHTLVGAPGREAFYTCPAGNPFMALGGMGDLLTGILAARWAALVQRGTDDPFLAACAAVWLHATASDRLISADPPGDPSIVNTAHAVGSFRVQLERR